MHCQTQTLVLINLLYWKTTLTALLIIGKIIYKRESQIQIHQIPAARPEVCTVRNEIPSTLDDLATC